MEGIEIDPSICFPTVAPNPSFRHQCVQDHNSACTKVGDGEAAMFLISGLLEEKSRRPDGGCIEKF